MNHRLTYSILFPLLATLLLALAACGGGGGDDEATGTVQLSFTDAAVTDFSAVVVAVKEVRAVPAGREGEGEAGLPLIVSYPAPKTINVLDLAFQQELLGSAVVPAGSYNQLRLVLAANTDPLEPVNYLVLAADPEQRKIPLDTPSGQQSGLKVLGRFTVEPGQVSTVVLDFDPSRAIEAGQSGKWLFQPTGIRVVETNTLLLAYGAITGEVVQDVTSGGVTTRTPVTDAVVLAVPQGGSTPVAAGPVNTVDGSFRLFLPAGSYELRATAAGFDPYSSLPVVFPATQGADTDAGSIVLKPVAPK
jgi:hypothetical protein